MVNSTLYELVKSTSFARWLSGLRDPRAKVRIAVRLDRLSFGNPGDVKPFGSGQSDQE